MKRTLKKITYYSIGLVVLLNVNCATSLILNESEYLVRPTGISVTAQAGGTFQFSYYIQNTEGTFDGYNLYITKESTGDSGGNQSIDPYQRTGSVPTLIHSPDEVDLVTAITVNIDKYMEISYSLDGSKVITYVPFEAGVTYFFKLKAHSQFDVISEYSEEISGVSL